MNETAEHQSGHFDGETLMSYIYGELDGPAAVRVEDHLLECGNCSTEFADLSEGHLSVFEWNKLEFEPLAAPAIRIDYAKKRGALAAFAETIATAGKWRLAVPAFAAFVIAVSGFVMYSGILSTGTEVAVEPPRTAASPADKPQPAAVIEQAAADPELVETQIVPEPSGEVTEKARVVTVSDHRAPKRIRKNRAARPPIQNETLPSAMTIADAPMRLSDFEESDDDSPRLSDLFDESETS